MEDVNNKNDKPELVLKKWDPKSIPDDASIVMIGKRGTGMAWNASEIVYKDNKEEDNNNENEPTVTTNEEPDNKEEETVEENVENNPDNNEDEESDDDILEFMHAKEKIVDNTAEKIKAAKDFVFGIDLGTTNSCISLWRNNCLEVIPDEYGNKTIPSIVAYSNVSKYVGYDAKNQKDINTDNVFYEVKRLIGRKYDDKDVQNEKEMLSYDIVSDEKNNVCLQSTVQDNRKFTPEEISANVLMKLKSMAKRYIGCDEVKNVVITIPANFNDGQRQATKDAAEIAGLNPLMLINEPTAAALAYGMMYRSKTKRQTEDGEIEVNTVELDEDYLTLLVYDFGGGTLDVSLLVVCDGIFEVKASSGNTHFGGADFDDRVMVYCMDYFKKKFGYEKLNNLSKLSLQKLRKECENAKKILSTSTKTYIAVRNFYEGRDLFIGLTRKNFEKICMDLFLVCLEPVNDILDITDTEIDEVDEVILVGGMTKIPYIRQMLKSKFMKDANCSINPNEAISAGAAIQGYLINNRDDPFTKNIGLIDVTSLSLGVETNGGVMDTIVERKTVLPCEKSRVYTTDTDEVDSVLIKIFEGERSMTRNNYFVGEFELGNIPPAPRGFPQIEVTFSINTNGIISVTAKDLDTEEFNSVTVTGNKGRLSREEIDALVERCREQEYMDEIERVKKVNHYEMEDLCQTILENLDNKDFKLNNKDKAKIRTDIESTIKWLNEVSYEERDIDEIDDKLEKLKDKYGTLILRGNIREGKFTENNEGNNKELTTVYGNEEEDEKEINMVFEKIEDDELGVMGMTDVEKDEIKELRKNLMELCYSVHDVTKSDNFIISKEHKEELIDFINDTLLWVHSKEKPTKAEYKLKIDEVDESCNKIMSHYENKNEEIFAVNKIVKSNENIFSELENLCFTIQLMANDNTLPIDESTIEGEEDTKLLLNTVHNNIEWVFKHIHDAVSLNEKEKKSKEELEIMCKKRLDDLNALCDELYSRHVNSIYVSDEVIVPEYATEETTSNVEETTDNVKVNNESSVSETIVDSVGGTSLMDLIKIRQEREMRNLINTNDETEIESIENNNTDESKVAVVDDNR